MLCQNIGQVVHCLEMGAQAEVGSNIPVTNELDLALMARLGVEKVWLSPELRSTQIEEAWLYHAARIGRDNYGCARVDGV